MMELLDVTLTTLQRRNRAAFVHQREIPGAPALIPGQRVVLRDEEGDYFAGTVVDGDPVKDGTVEGDTRYHVHVGVRLPEEYALMRLGRRHPSGLMRDDVVDEVVAGPRDEVDELDALLELLGEAREVAGRIPAQRAAR